MAQCSNCQKQITCGCQKRVASDGKSVCTSCISNYENSIKVTQLPEAPKSVRKIR